MARSLRICIPNVTYHTYSRCIETRDMMENDALKEAFVLIIGSALEKYSFKLISYQIMNNHFHFIIKTCENGASISRIMQFIKARYAEKYNRLHSRTGPFWNERFKDQIIERLEDPSHYLLLLLWHLAFNPVREKKTNNPRNYRFGCIGFYLDEEYQPELPLTHHDFYINLGGSFKDRVRAFLQFEEIYKARLSVKTPILALAIKAQY